MRAHPEEEREYECSVSFTYNAESPGDAGLQFITELRSVDNLAMHPGWDIEVRDTESGLRWNVDGESGEAEQGPLLPANPALIATMLELKEMRDAAVAYMQRVTDEWPDGTGYLPPNMNELAALVIDYDRRRIREAKARRDAREQIS